MMARTYGRIKAIKTEAEACSPSVLEKISTDSPSRNPDKSKSHLGVSKGSSKMNSTYIKGFTYPLN
jgi:hypothetical protein